MGVILSATDALNWHSHVTGKSAAELSSELGDTLKAPSGVTFLPYLSGERTPHNDAKIRGVFAGLEHESSRVVLTQAVMEGVTFAIRDNLAALNAAGTTISRVTAIGGGSRSRYWLKSIATALNIPVDIPADGDFGAAFGRRGSACWRRPGLIRCPFAPRRRRRRRWSLRRRSPELTTRLTDATARFIRR